MRADFPVQPPGRPVSGLSIIDEQDYAGPHIRFTFYI